MRDQSLVEFERAFARLMIDTPNFEKWLTERRMSILDKMGKINLESPDGVRDIAALKARCDELQDIERDLRLIGRPAESKPIDPTENYD